jgi:uncharacterized protein YlxP (DUF503 family)
VGIVSAELHFPETTSLKGKRMFLRSMRDHLTGRYGASFAEVSYQDLWQRSRVVFAVAASDQAVLQRTLDAAIGYLDSQEWELVATDEEVIELDA